jgi:hypothetical protein
MHFFTIGEHFQENPCHTPCSGSHARVPPGVNCPSALDRGRRSPVATNAGSKRDCGHASCRSYCRLSRRSSPRLEPFKWDCSTNAAFVKCNKKRTGTRAGLLSHTADTRISSHFAAFSPTLLLLHLTNAALSNTSKVARGTHRIFAPLTILQP